MYRKINRWYKRYRFISYNYSVRKKGYKIKSLGVKPIIDNQIRDSYLIEGYIFLRVIKERFTLNKYAYLDINGNTYTI